MKILGIDPSIHRTGWGIIEIKQDKLIHIEHGVIRTSPKAATEDRLCFICNAIVELVKAHSPNIACLEETFCGINPITTLRLGYTFGALLATFSSMKVPIFKYPTKIVKRLIANKGSSSKDDVERRVMEILNISHIDNQDSSDALAVAITYVFERRNNLETNKA